MKKPIYVIIPTTPERKDRLAMCIDAVKKSTYDPVVVCTYENTLGGCVEPQIRMLQGINGIVFILNDDMIVDEKCIEKLMEKYQYGLLLQPDDHIHGGTLATASFGHSDTIKKYLHPGYKHNFNDNEITERAIIDGVYTPVLDAKLYHLHFSMNPELVDDTYRSSQSFFEQDRELYIKRKSLNYET